MKYKVGDKVLIKSLDWYNENRDKIGQVDCGCGCVYAYFVPSMVTFCGQIVTISSVQTSLEAYRIKEDGGTFKWTDEMIEGIFSEEKKPLTFGDSWECPQGYQFVDENGNVINAQKITLEKKEKIYPRTYEECCEIVKVEKKHTLEGEIIRVNNYKIALLESFQKLLICRDAYWKIAGEEMGLEKSWKPDWKDESLKYVILYDNGEIRVDTWNYIANRILSFPTDEMRDAFYENFKELIEICKELL